MILKNLYLIWAAGKTKPVAQNSLSNTLDTNKNQNDICDSPDRYLGIGINNDLPWHISEDLKYFKEKTEHHSVVMGLNTWNSLPEKARPLKNRKNIVISHISVDLPEGVLSFNSLESFLEYAKENQNELFWIIGGGMLYKTTAEYASKFYQTQVVPDDIPEYDTFGPSINPNEVSPEYIGEFKRDKNMKYRFTVYKRNDSRSE